MNALEKKTLNIRKFGTPSPNIFARLKYQVAHRIKSIFGNGLLFNGQTNYDWTAIYHYSKASKEDLVNKGFATNVTVYAAITTIARVAAQAPWGVYRVKNEKAYQRLKALQSQPYSKEQQLAVALVKEQALEPFEGHYLNDKFRNPNEQQSGAEYMENLLGYKLLTGDSYEYANIAESSGRIAELWILPSQKVQIMAGEYGSFPMREKGYKVLIGSKSISYTPEEVCHSKYWSPFYSGDGDNLYGFSPLDAAWLSNLQDNNAREAAVELLKNRGKRGVFMWENDKLSEGGFVATQSKIKEDWSQSDKEYKDKILPVYGRGQFIDVGLAVKDLAILEICDMNKDDICNSYGISSILLNNMESTNVDNYKTARKELITRCAMPLLGTIRDARNRMLSNGSWNAKKESIVCDFDPTVFTELYEDVWAMGKLMKEIGVYTDNEIRIQTNYEGLKNPLHDEVWKKTNDVPVSLINENTLTSNRSNGTGQQGN